jgi:hypothetical protein
MSNPLIMWPFGSESPSRLAPASAANVELAIRDRLTIVDYAPAAATTMTLDIDAETPDGALLVINVDQGGTGRNVTLSTGFVGDSLTGVANDKDTILAIYNKAAGTFRVVSKYKTVDAA